MLSPFRMVCRDLHSTRVCKLRLFMLFSICASYCTLSLFKNFASTLRHIFTSLKRLFGRKYDSGTRPMWRRPFACALLACFARIHADHPAAASVMMNGAPPPQFFDRGRGTERYSPKSAAAFCMAEIMSTPKGQFSMHWPQAMHSPAWCDKAA